MELYTVSKKTFTYQWTKYMIEENGLLNDAKMRQIYIFLFPR